MKTTSASNALVVPVSGIAPGDDRVCDIIPDDADCRSRDTGKEPARTSFINQRCNPDIGDNADTADRHEHRKAGKEAQATALVAESQSGATALQIAARRSPVPLIAVTPSARTAQQLAIVYGIKAYIRPTDPQAATKLTNWLKQNKVLHAGDVVVTASGRHPGVVGTTDTIKVRVL